MRKREGSNAVAVSLEELAECLPDGRDTTPDTAAAAFVGEVINAFVAGLPKRERVLFVRRYFYLDSVRQAAGYAQMTGRQREDDAVQITAVVKESITEGGSTMKKMELLEGIGEMDEAWIAEAARPVKRIGMKRHLLRVAAAAAAVLAIKVSLFRT